MQHTLRPLALAAVLACSASASLASAPANWIDWSSASTGTLTVGSNTINVSLSGSTPHSMEYGDTYYNNFQTGYTAPSGTYLGLAPHDMVRVRQPSTFTLSFSEAIVNPYIALVSVGQPTVAVSYTFSGTVASASAAGSNYWGPGTGSLVGNTFTGMEYNGVLQLSGSYTALTITTATDEYWHGFNVGVAAVPEPETYAMLLAGLGVLGAIGRRRKAQG